MTRERWFKLSFDEQMGNIWSEIGRAESWREKDLALSKISLERGLELLNLTIEDEKNQEKLSELYRVRGGLVDYFIEGNKNNSTMKGWDDYFYPYAVAATAKYFR